MNELENRVWRGLRDLADTVPYTPDARAHLAGRLAERRRRPLAVVAAAAVVIAVVSAAVAVPVVLATRYADPPAATTYPSPPPPDWVELGTYTENGAIRHAGLVIDRDGKGFCVDSSEGARPAPFACYAIPVWGKRVDPPRYVVIVGVLGTPGPATFAGPLPELLLYVTSPQVATLEVGNGAGDPVEVREVARTAEAAYFLADFHGPTEGRWYSARDTTGHVIDR